MDAPQKPTGDWLKDSLTDDVVQRAYDDGLKQVASLRRPFDYQAFVEDLRSLVLQANNFAAADRSPDSASFRRWRHEVSDLLDRIGKQRYNINCRLGGRAFRPLGYGPHGAKAVREQFDNDLADTLTELELVVRNYERYGDPKSKNAIPLQDMKPVVPPAVEVWEAPKQITPSAIRGLQISEVAPVQVPAITESPKLKVPEKITLKWLWEHMSLSGYVTLGGIFLSGMAFGNLELVKQLLQEAARHYVK